MTARARRLIAAAQHRIAGRDNGVITVARCTTGNTHLDENLAVRAFVEQL